MKVICCLGNPGPDYRLNRHNYGFMVGQELIHALSLEKCGNKFKSHLYEGRSGSEKIILMFPQTFMNLSGQAVQAIQRFYDLTPDDLVVIYDDFDIPFGSFRIRKSGSGGTHNGMKSIIQEISSTAFPRIRMGIGPKPSGWDTARFVLANFSKEELARIPEVCVKAAAAAESIIRDGVTLAMNRHNVREEGPDADV